MKHVKVLTVICLAASATAAFSATTYDTTPTGISGFTPSSNVVVGYASSTGQDVYSNATKHKQGNKCYGSTSGSTKMYQTDCTAGQPLLATDVPTTPSSPSDSTMAGGKGNWSAM